MARRSFDPTHPTSGRLARLGVVLDAADRDGHTAQLARLCDRAGIEAIWLRIPADGASLMAAASLLLERIQPMMTQARIGLQADGSTVVDVPPGVDEIEVAATSIGSLSKSGRAVRVGAVVAGLQEVETALDGADDIVLESWRTGDLEMMADEVRAECVERGRPAATLGVAVVIPTSIGRTVAEAAARADMDDGFGRFGDVATSGIFGTLEECQDRVIALAHAGVTDIRCVLPAAADLHDVIAQLTAVTVGSTAVLRPGSLRSPAPPPPQGWGGRPGTPPKPGVSGGSRRR